MDRYKHNASIQRMQRTKCSPIPANTETPEDLVDKPMHNGTGMIVVYSHYRLLVKSKCRDSTVSGGALVIDAYDGAIPSQCKPLGSHLDQSEVAID